MKVAPLALIFFVSVFTSNLIEVHASNPAPVSPILPPPCPENEQDTAVCNCCQQVEQISKCYNAISSGQVSTDFMSLEAQQKVCDDQFHQCLSDPTEECKSRRLMPDPSPESGHITPGDLPPQKLNSDVEHIVAGTPSGPGSPAGPIHLESTDKLKRHGDRPQPGPHHKKRHSPHGGKKGGPTRSGIVPRYTPQEKDGSRHAEMTLGEEDKTHKSSGKSWFWNPLASLRGGQRQEQQHRRDSKHTGTKVEDPRAGKLDSISTADGKKGKGGKGVGKGPMGLNDDEME